MVKKFTVSDLAQYLGVSTTAVYKKIKNKQFETIEETVGSRRITFVVVEESQLEVIAKEARDNKEFTKVGYKSLESHFTDSPRVSESVAGEGTADVSSRELAGLVLTIQNNMNQQFETYSRQLADYAEKAGQVKLLTDNAKFYQDEYFRIKFENDALTSRNIAYEEELKALKLKLEHVEGDLKNFKIIADNAISENKTLKEVAESKKGILGFFKK